MAVKASRGESILILNPDSYLAENTVERLHAHSLNLSSPFMIGARILNEDGSDQRGCRRALLTPKTAFVEALHLARFFPDLRLNLEREPIPSSLSPIPAISGAFMFLPRRDFDLIGGFDEGFFLHVEDLDFCYRFRRAGGEIYFAPDVRATHIGGTSEVSSNFIESHKRRGFIRYFHKNFGQKTPWPLLWCLDLAIWMRYLLRRFLVP
jgi:GT2 family glycosyltransferase